VKLSGRPGAPIKRRRCILSSRAGGAQPQAVHGPLERWLEDASNEVTAIAPPGSVKRRVFGSSSQLFMTFKASLGCGL
jgi:hypothetical protein